jgi:hydrogenase-1 operon protein HyaF
MNPLNVPVFGLGAGAEPVDEPLPVLDSRREFSSFVMRRVAQSEDREHFAQATEILRRMIDAMSVHRGNRDPYPRLELTRLDPATVELLDQMMTAGEVSALLTTPVGQVKIQETNFPGIWRVQHHDHEGALVHDYMEACSVPEMVGDVARGAAVARIQPPEPPPGVMNSPTVLFEIQEHATSYRAGTEPHVVNLTLLPLSPEDGEHIKESLPPGPVTVVSRGYGKCRICSTLLRNVWRVQYFNTTDALILDTIEVVDIPEVVKASPDDLEDSVGRLRELLEWMEQE